MTTKAINTEMNRDSEYLQKVYQALNNVSEEFLETTKSEKISSIPFDQIELKPGMIIVLKGCFPPALKTDSGSDDATIGHAAVVSEDTTKLIEAVDYGGKDNEGRVRESNYNDFFSKKGTYYWLYPKDKKASDSKGVYAAIYAKNQVGKPYNHNYFNKWSKDEFYCSSLCWRAWYEQDIHIGTPSFFPYVAPNDLISFGTKLINKWEKK
jgi:uncharacterized protein YycO